MTHKCQSDYLGNQDLDSPMSVWRIRILIILIYPEIIVSDYRNSGTTESLYRS